MKFAQSARQRSALRWRQWPARSIRFAPVLAMTASLIWRAFDAHRLDGPADEQEKENIMNDQKSKERPLYRVTFSRILGQDAAGKDVLSHPKEIGAAWPRKNGKGGAVLNFDIIPTDLVSRAGVIFLVPMVADEQVERVD